MPHSQDPQQPGTFSKAQKQSAMVVAVESEWWNGDDPRDKILRYLSMVNAERLLCVVTPFDLEPLTQILSKRGFKIEVERASDRVLTWIGAERNIHLYNHLNSMVSENSFEAHVLFFAGRMRMVNVSSMKMPEPMITIFRELDLLPQGSALFVIHCKVPVMILPEIEERGFACEIYQVQSSTVYLLIYRRPDLIDRED